MENHGLGDHAERVLRSSVEPLARLNAGRSKLKLRDAVQNCAFELHTFEDFLDALWALTGNLSLRGAGSFQKNDTRANREPCLKSPAARDEIFERNVAPDNGGQFAELLSGKESSANELTIAWNDLLVPLHVTRHGQPS